MLGHKPQRATTKTVVLLTIILSVLILSSNQTPISRDNILSFFNHTLDPNQDGYATLDEFIRYYTLMEPENAEIVNSVH